MVAASKVHMLKPGEYELWRMRMKQYIQMIDYYLCEVIENGNAPPITNVIEGIETTIALTTAEEKHKEDKEVKGTSNSSTNTQNIAFVSTNSSTNGVVNTAHGITTTSTQATAINSTTIDNLSDAVICDFFASQPNSPQLDNEDLQQIHLDDLEEMDLRWQMAMLTIRARRFLKNTRRKFFVNGTETIGFDKSKSDQAEEGPTNFALMAYSSTISNAEVSIDSNCSSSCLENVKILKEQNEQLLKDLRTSKLNAIAYKTGLESVEARLLVYKKNESVYEEDIKVLKREIHLREVAITELRRKLELAQKQKDEIQLTVENFENSSKNLSKLIDCQIVDKCKTGLGYNVVPPPYTGNFMPPKPDLSFSGLEEFTSEPIVIKPVAENSEAKASEESLKQLGRIMAKIEKKTFKPSFAKIEFVKPKQQEKTARKTVNHVKQNRQNIHTPRGNQRNWNNMMSQRLGRSEDDIPPPPPPQTQTPTQQAPHTVSTIKLPILKKGEYDIWAMKMEHYLAHTDYPIWEVIQRGNGPVSVSTDTNGVIKVLPPKTAEEILARERERKARTTLLMALPEDHLAKFHKMTDAKEMWEAIKSRFGGNDESKKMQKYILKQQFEGFSVSNSEGLHKGYDRTKPGVDNLSFDDLYNNLRVFEPDVKGSTASSSSTQNVAFVSENTSSTNEIDELMYSFFANQSSGPQLDHEDLEQLDEFDLEEMDLKWQVAMISMRLKKFYKKTGRKLQFDAKEPVSFDKTKVECYNCHKTGHFARECRSKGNQDSKRRDAGYTGYKAKDSGRRLGKQEEPKALVTLDGYGVDWTSHSEDEQENYALMAYSNSGSDTEVNSCSKECKESYAKLKKLYDEQREQLGDASIEIQAYTQALKKVEAQLVAHQQNQLWYKEKIRFMKIDLDDKTDVLTYHKKLLAEAEKEKEELKAKVEKWHNSSKGHNILLNSQMSARDKVGLGYGNQMHKGVLSYENEVFGSVFDSRSSDIEDSLLNDRYAEGMHAVPPPMTGIYIPSGHDVEIDESQYTYGQKQSKSSESNAETSNFASCESNSSVETNEFVPKPVANEPKAVSEPKVWSDAPIIEKYESDNDDEHVSLPTKEPETPSFAFVNTVKHVKTPRQTVKEQNTCSQSPKPNKKNYSGLMSKKLSLGYGFTKKACFVCGSFSHLIRDCDFHDKRMAKKVELNKQKGKGTVQRENKPDDPQKALKNKGIVDSGCSRHMTGNKAYLVDYQDYNGGPVAFGGSKCYITDKGKISTGKLDFKDVCFVKELQLFNLFSVLQTCDKKNKVLFTDTECLVLSPDFKLPDENQVLLRVPRQNNMYNFNLENIVPFRGLTCLIAKATVDESNKWHRMLGHVNFKNLNKLVKGNLVKGLPSKIFQNDHTCVAYQKGKQHKASCKAKLVSSISQSL
ncbi:ribonuclease H-like domain-containing protein [Tanacetum coccineum]|uniref:Ribonuclease H-like domain-containing protein n=1 Tax=Tanacetum coccineum TaxID=301880 RepID=A0ABQ4ZQI2_9ASTR